MMAGYRFNKEEYFKETKEVYSNYPTDVSRMEEELDRLQKENPKASSFQKKTWIYRIAARDAEVILFPSSPFYAEIDTGREQNSVTASFPPQPGIGCWLMKQYPDFVDEYGEWSGYYGKYGVMNGPQFMDAAHHYANCETVLKYGLSGIIRHAMMRLEEKNLTDHQQDFLKCMVDVCRSLQKISERFAEKAEEMLKTEHDEEHVKALKMIAVTARRIPSEPAETFYEAMCAIWFTREMCNALDGLGFAVIGHLDRILISYYERDLKNNRITPDEAQELVDCFVSMTDARWDLEADLPGGTNADIIIGGCDKNGNIVYNDISRMIINSYKKYHFANPKLQVRISAKHPDEFLMQVGELAGMGLNVLSVFNDDVIIPANQKQGKSLEDCRLYVAGGCQEICLSNEVNSRAYTYLNLVQMLNGSLYPEYWNDVFKRDGFKFIPAANASDFEEFYHIVIENYRNELNFFVKKYNEYGSWWKIINPSLFFSATMPSCTETAKDVSEGGAVYNTDNFAAAGAGTVIDSIYAIKKAVYEDKITTFGHLLKAMKEDFRDDEILRQYLLHKVPKFCKDKDATEFGKKVMDDLAECLGGQANYRGGKFEPSLFAFYSYNWFKNVTIATADGRKSESALSRGVNPSESTENINIAALLDAIKTMDYTKYPGGAVIYMDIPLMYKTPQPSLFASVMRVFCENGGSIMDFNVISRNALLEAQKNPETHKNIVVRVCGYSAYFHTLTAEMQNEVIQRTQR